MVTSELVQAILARRQWLTDEKKAINDKADAEIRSIDIALASLVPKSGQASAKPTPAIVKPAPRQPAVKDTKQAPGLKNAVLNVIKSSKEPVREDRIAITLLMSDFKPGLSDADFIKAITEEALSLIADGKVKTVGDPPNRKYASLS
jgi:hypothetical protein